MKGCRERVGQHRCFCAQPPDIVDDNNAGKYRWDDGSPWDYTNPSNDGSSLSLPLSALGGIHFKMALSWPQEGGSRAAQARRAVIAIVYS